MSVDKALQKLELPSLEEAIGIQEPVDTIVSLFQKYERNLPVKDPRIAIDNSANAYEFCYHRMMEEFKMHLAVLRGAIAQTEPDMTLAALTMNLLAQNIPPSIRVPRRKEQIELYRLALEKLFSAKLPDMPAYDLTGLEISLRAFMSHGLGVAFISPKKLELASNSDERTVLDEITKEMRQYYNYQPSSLTDLYNHTIKKSLPEAIRLTRKLGKIARHVRKPQYYGFERMMLLPEFARQMTPPPDEIGYILLEDLAQLMMEEQETPEITDSMYLPLALLKYFLRKQKNESLCTRIFKEHLEKANLQAFCEDDEIVVNTATKELDLNEEHKEKFIQLSEKLPPDQLFDPRFQSIYTQACKTGWEDHIYDNLDSIQPLLHWHRVVELLSKQESGALLQLMQDEITRQAVIDNPQDLRYESLTHLKETDDAAYKFVIGNISRADQKTIDKILELSSYKQFRPFNITTTTKTILSNGRMNCEEDAEQIAMLLTESQIIDEAAEHNLVGKPDYTRPNRLAEWYKTHRDSIIGELRSINKAKAYIGPYTGRKVREACVALREKTDGLDNLLKPFQDLDPAAYHRILTLLAKLNSPKEALRKREMQNLLYNFANTGRWDKFAEQVEEINGQKAKDYDPLIKQYGGHIAKKEKANGSVSKTIQAHMAAHGEQMYDLFERVLDLRDQYNYQTIDAALDAIIEGQRTVLEFILPHMAAGVQEKTVTDFFDTYKRDEDFEIASPYDLIDGWPAEEPEEEIEEKPPVEITAQEWCDEHEFPHGLLERILVRGFKLNGSKLIGMNYTRARHVRSNTGGGADEGQMGQYFDKMIRALHRENAIIHHPRKGGTVTTGCIAINPHINEIKSKNLMEYVRFLLYERN